MGNVLNEQKEPLTVIVVEFGDGVVEPTDRFTDEEVANEIERTQEAIQDPAIVCMDERKSVNGPEPVRRKTAGGAGMTGFMGAIYSDWYLLGENAFTKSNANAVFDEVVGKVKDAGIALGGHTDSHAEGKKTHCGAKDGAAAANTRIAELGDQLSGVVAHFMGDEFDPELAAIVITRAKKLEEAEFFAAWDPVAAQETEKRLGAVIEVLDGANNYEEFDATNARHGHMGESVNHNRTAGKSNNRDASNIPGFQFDEEPVDDIWGRLGRNEHEAKLAKHGVYFYTVAIAKGLIKNQRISQT